MGDFIDLSNVCDYYPPEKAPNVKVSKKSRKKRRMIDVDQSESRDTNLLENWSRKSIYDQQWNKIEQKLMNFTSFLFHKYVEKLYEFVQRYSTQEKVKLKDKNDIGFNYGLLPSALIALNSKETQERIANELSEMFENNDLIDIKAIHLNCFNSTNMNNVFSTLSSAILSEDICNDNDIDEPARKYMTFDDLFQIWFKSFPKLKTPVSSSLVIFIYDFENFNKQVLINLILILKEYVKDVPIIFIFMIYNQLNSSIQYFLPAQATDYLFIEDIQPYYEPKFISRLMKEFVVDSSIEFKIHPNLLKEIYCYFTNFEFSFANLIFFIKSLVFDYFYTNPLSTVCQDCDIVKILPSDNNLLQIFKNSLPLGSTVAQSDKEYIKQISIEYQDLLTKHEEFVFNLEVIIDLHKFCYVSCKNFILLYFEMVNVTDYDFREELLSNLSKVTQSVWNVGLRKIIEKYNENNGNQLVKTFIGCFNELNVIIQAEKKELDEQENSAKKLGLDCEVKIMKNKLRNLGSRLEWRESINPNKLKKNYTKFELWKINLFILMEKVLQKSSPSRYNNLMDSLFYNNADFIHKHYFVSIRENLHFTLENPGKNRYSIEPSSDKSGTFKNVYPNSFILYQLYKDASPVINLYDWYEEFVEEKKMIKGKKFSNNELIVNFLSTVSDFEFIGLLQASKYKADYFNKLVWL